MDIKSTSFEIQKSFKHKFLCTINFKKNESDKKNFLSSKKGGSRGKVWQMDPPEGSRSAPGPQFFEFPERSRNSIF